MTDTTMTVLALTTEIRDREATMAPGSETLLWGEYIENMRRNYGHDVLEIERDQDDVPTVPVATADWWRGAYRIVSWAEEDPERWDRIYGDGADNVWQWVLNCCQDPAGWTPPGEEASI